MILRRLAEQISQDRNLRQARDAAQRLGLRIFHDAADQAGLRHLSAEFRARSFFWPMMGWLMPPMFDWPTTEEISMVIFSVTSPVGVHVRRDVDVHADIEVLKLRIDQRVDADAADAGLERSGGDRHALADLERGLLIIEGANLRILNQLGVAVAHHRRQVRRRNRDLEIGRVQVAQGVQTEPGAAGEVVVVVVVVRGGAWVVVIDIALQSDGALVGGLKPRVRDLSLLTCITAMSTITSGRALSRSSTNFSASAI